MTDHRQDKKTSRLQHERLLLIIYAVAVTAALIVSLRNNNNVEASAPFNQEMSAIAPEAFEEDTALIEEDLKQSDDDTAVVLDDEQEISPNVGDIVAANATGTNEEIITIAKGDTFIGILTRLGLEYATANEITQAFNRVYDVRKLKIGQTLHISTTTDNTYNDVAAIEKLMLEPTNGTRYVVEKNSEGKYESRVEKDELSESIKTVSGLIEGNVSVALQNAGVPSNVAGNFINIFSFSVDFRRDIHAGDKFEIRYEQKTAPNGQVVQNGDIIYAALTLGKDQIALYRYKDKSGTVDYYDEQGLALKKTLDRKPLSFKNARISSRFGRRFHPILKSYRHHDGVDYAAPMGTKVYASGDGVVTLAKWVGGYGYMVQIRHNSEYTTGYAHLRSFAKGIRPGVRVKQGQVIAYVGSTGRSTGPHLHFEVVKNGQKVDPLKVKAATGENLKGAKLTEFKKIVAEIKAAGENSEPTQTATAETSAQ